MDSREVIDRPVWTLIIATIAVLTSSWMSRRMPSAVRSFAESLEALGAEVPAPTRWVLSAPNFWLVFVALAVALFIWIMARSRVTRREHGRMKLALGALIVLMLLAYGLAAWAIYTPLFEMGKVV